MKYDFYQHIGIENWSNSESLYRRMLQVLDRTGVEVTFNLLPKKERYFLNPIGRINTKEGGLKMWFCFFGRDKLMTEQEMEKFLTKQFMVQVIKKALKNYIRKRQRTIGSSPAPM